MNKFKIAAVLIILCVIVSGVTCGTAYATWTYSNTVYDSSDIGFRVPEWDFVVDTDYAKVEWIDTNHVEFLEYSQETSLLCGSVEAIRFTNTAGTQGKNHTFIMKLDRNYTVGEIKIQKVSFDYYFAEKRSENNRGKGFPKVELVNGTTRVGNTVGGEDSVPALASYTAVELDGGWWHLEYFITAMVPTFGDHGDVVISESKVVNGIRITDSAIYDYGDEPAFVIVDNLQVSSAACSKLGLFNRTKEFSVGGYYWVKVAWAGEIHSVNITFSDDTIAEYTPSEKSPFYIYGLKAGTVTITVTMELGDEHQILSLSNTIKVK